MSFGNAAVAGSTATKSGLSASLIFLASASAWAADSCPAAAGSTYTGAFFSAVATSSTPDAAGAAAVGAMVASVASAAAENAIKTRDLMSPTLPDSPTNRTNTL